MNARLLLVFALIGLAAAAGYALAPVRQATHLYSFDPADTGRDPAIASLAIARSQPDALLVTLPCDVPGSQFRSMTLGNWAAPAGAQRSPIEYQDLGIALQVGVGDGFAFMALGGTEIFRLDVAHAPGCVVSVDFNGELWSFTAADQERSTSAGSPRFAEALFAGPAVTSDVASVTVATRQLGSSPSGVQFLLAGVAVLMMGLVAHGLAAAGRRTRSTPDPAVRRRMLERVGLVDVAVGVGLIAWILLIPAGFDDGWVVARQSAYDAHGAFSNLFDLDAAVLPLAQWVEWLQHFWLGWSANSLFARLPILGLAGVTWLGIRWLLRSFGGERSPMSLWVMAAVFLVGYGAWNVTLRPEPVLAALLVASLVLAVKFGSGDRGWTLVAWAAVIALGFTAHPAGVIVVAPLLASWRKVMAWLRSSREAIWLGATTLVLLASLTTMGFFLDSNLDQRLESIESLQAGGHDKSILDETLRYEFLGEAPYGATMRRASVTLILVGVGLFIVGIGRRTGPVARLPGRSLLLAVALLALTPSKWSWHFGGLVGLAALVVALELARNRQGLDAAVAGRPRALSTARWGAGALGIVVVAAWAWRIATPWTALDLRTMEWSPGAVNMIPFDLSSVSVWLGIGAATVVAMGLAERRRGRSRYFAPEVIMLVSAGLVIGVTGATLVLDTARTDGWTFGRQNIQSLWGGAACGLGEEVVIPLAGSLHALGAVSGSGSAVDVVATQAGFAAVGELTNGGFPPIGVNGIRPGGFNAVRPLVGMEDIGSWVAGASPTPESAVGGFISRWYALDDEDSVGLMMMGSVWDWDPDGNAIAVQWGLADDDSVLDRGLENIDLSGYFVDWTFAAFARPGDTDRVRVLVRDARSEGESSWVASSMPLGFSSGAIPAVAGSADILVTPPLGLYFPCVDAPGLDVVVARAPGVIINLWRVAWQTTFAAAAASDRYFRIPVDLAPPVRTPQIGAHLGDSANFVFVSQEYLTGRPARVNGEFTLIEP